MMPEEQARVIWNQLPEDFRTVIKQIALEEATAEQPQSGQEITSTMEITEAELSLSADMLNLMERQIALDAARNQILLNISESLSHMTPEKYQ